MEMSSGCLTPSEQSAMRPGRPIRGPHGGWQKQEIDALQRSIDEAAVSGESLRSVFDRMGAELGRKPNSIRNFYYAQVRAQTDGESSRTLPFETFSQSEVENLVRRVLTARAQGMSVRACVRSLADGDRTRMLRYQNKYRSTVRTRPELVHRIMNQLAEEGVPFVSPYAPADGAPAVGMEGLRQRAQESGNPQLIQLFSSLDYLLDLALAYEPDGADNAEEASAFSPDNEDKRRADRYRARCDLLRIALDDEQLRANRLRCETESMVTLLKEYIALPDTDRTDKTEAFCRQAAARLSAVECALMEAQN